MPAKLDRCVEEVKKDPDVEEPFAVCTEAINDAKLANLKMGNLLLENTLKKNHGI